MFPHLTIKHVPLNHACAGAHSERVQRQAYLLHTMHARANLTATLRACSSQVASAAVCLGCTAAGLHKTDVALAQVPPPEFAAFLSLVDPKLATLLAFAQSLKAVRGWLIFSLAASSIGVIAASLLLAVALSASLRGWLSRTGRHTGALKAEVAVSAILAVLALAAAGDMPAQVATPCFCPESAEQALVHMPAILCPKPAIDGAVDAPTAVLFVASQFTQIHKRSMLMIVIVSQVFH